MISYMKKTVLVTAVIGAFTMGSLQAQEAPKSKADVTFEKFSQVIANTPDDISQVPYEKLDYASEFISRSNSSYTPIIFGGRRFLLDSNGTTLVNPNEAFVFSEEGVVRAGDILVDMDFERTKDVWPSVSLPEGVEKRGDLYVISDPTCGFCQKIDNEVNTYIENGIQVHYVPYPRSGLQADLPAYQMWAAALCSESPGEAYIDISMGKSDNYPVPDDLNAPCTKLIEEGYLFGANIGISGTPYMYGITTDGTALNMGVVIEQPAMSVMN